MPGCLRLSDLAYLELIDTKTANEAIQMSTSRNFGGKSLAQATSINATQTLNDRLGGSNQTDTFRLSLSQPMRFSLKGSSSGQSAQVQLISDLNQNGRVDRGEVLKSFSLRKGKNQQGSLSLDTLPTGTYFVQVTGSKGATSYSLSLESVQNTGLAPSGAPSSTPSSTPSSSTPSSIANSTFSSTPSGGSDFASRVIALTNAFRNANGLASLKGNSTLATIAQTYSQTMATQDFVAHQSLDGSQPWDRMTAGGYKWTRSAENIAAGQETPEEAVQSWIDSPTHRANLLDPQLKEIGVGYYFLATDTGNTNYNYYWTQEFGTSFAGH
jgi:uncharacterized protein YkwD